SHRKQDQTGVRLATSAACFLAHTGVAQAHGAFPLYHGFLEHYGAHMYEIAKWAVMSCMTRHVLALYNLRTTVVADVSTSHPALRANIEPLFNFSELSEKAESLEKSRPSIYKNAKKKSGDARCSGIVSTALLHAMPMIHIHPYSHAPYAHAKPMIHPHKRKTVHLSIYPTLSQTQIPIPHW